MERRVGWREAASAKRVCEVVVWGRCIREVGSEGGGQPELMTWGFHKSAALRSRVCVCM